MSRQPTVSDGTTPRRSSIAASAGLGVLAAAVGYLLTYLLIGSDVREAFDGDVATWKGVAWYFYNAHLVDIEVSGSVGSFGGTDTMNLIAESSATNAGLLYVVPPLALLAAGALLARRLHAADFGEAVAVGAPVAIGYAVVMGIGAVVAETGAEGSFFGIGLSGSMAPELAPAVLLGGILYPLVFAPTGAALALLFAER
ncbi:hypothetical protein [Haloterrigena alkaliphila]|uniref:DUF7978 domain-containing protein n=1 Tax=Haloterrigena alkaliphila TaxID=2816475 RepID=A0A8A2VEJ5_9EURY|nr:hypothetical protein [Haloterrigena alkaliphila]QSX00480.1 hypothetical protein J0X25_05830 [Haloterrigena alkaliphila]